MTPCDWPTLGCDTCCDLDIPPDIMDAASISAQQWLWESTKRRFGNCEVTIRPCLSDCNTSTNISPWWPWRDPDGGWVNVGCGRCGSTCSCSAISEVILPTPGEVSAVELAGVALVEGTDWRLDNMRRLVRLGGRWPRCQDMTADPPTWAVTYTPGLPVPEMGQLAAGQLACQLARRACGQKCDIPTNATVVNRQGVSILIEPGEKTGLWMVDNWIEMMNRPLAKVWSPDMSVTRTVTASESPGSP